MNEPRHYIWNAGARAANLEREWKKLSTDKVTVNEVIVNHASYGDEDEQFVKSLQASYGEMVERMTQIEQELVALAPLVWACKLLGNERP